jgi:hypothetical protein
LSEFDQLTGPQQMAMAQLVYQMGVNLQHFTESLTLINGEAGQAPGPQVAAMDLTISAGICRSYPAVCGG